MEEFFYHISVIHIAEGKKNTISVPSSFISKDFSGCLMGCHNNREFVFSKNNIDTSSSSFADEFFSAGYVVFFLPPE